MTYLECKDCGNKKKFVAACLYRYLVDSRGEEISEPEMDDLPEYQCESCGSTNINIDVI